MGRLRRAFHRKRGGGRVVGPFEQVDLSDRPAAEGVERDRLLKRRGSTPVLWHPPMVPAATVVLPPQDLVLGAEREGEARMYPTATLRRHHIVNDRLAGEPFVVTF